MGNGTSVFWWQWRKERGGEGRRFYATKTTTYLLKGKTKQKINLKQCKKNKKMKILAQFVAIYLALVNFKI